MAAALPALMDQMHIFADAIALGVLAVGALVDALLHERACDGIVRSRRPRRPANSAYASSRPRPARFPLHSARYAWASATAAHAA